MHETIGNLLYDYGEMFILSALEDGEYAIAGEPLEELESGLKLIGQTEAYKNFGYPSRIPFLDIKNAKTFRERFRGAG